MDYRRQGYLNSGFSQFVNWLISIYSHDYKIIHYIASRYPTIPPLIQTYHIGELHNQEIQSTITGISTFYLPPRDVVQTHRQTAIDLGLITADQTLVVPASPMRDISSYGAREMTAFNAYQNFSIPRSYKWQSDTEAANFLIELRMDLKLQNL